jgi:hypothetical protein
MYMEFYQAYAVQRFVLFDTKNVAFNNTRCLCFTAKAFLTAVEGSED